MNNHSPSKVPNKSPRNTDPLMGIIIIVRVALVLVVWIGLFLAMFLGYFTVPILLVGGLTLLYAILDVSLYVVLKRVGGTRRARREFLRARFGEEKKDQSE